MAGSRNSTSVQQPMNLFGNFQAAFLVTTNPLLALTHFTTHPPPDKNPRFLRPGPSLVASYSLYIPQLAPWLRRCPPRSAVRFVPPTAVSLTTDPGAPHRHPKTLSPRGKGEGALARPSIVFERKKLT